MSEAYKLAYNAGFIFAKGSEKVLRNLLRLPGAGRADGCIYFLASRASFLAAEMIASPASVTDEYRDARADCMITDELKLEEVRLLLYE